jgi:hypothetical protein
MASVGVRDKALVSENRETWKVFDTINLWVSRYQYRFNRVIFRTSFREPFHFDYMQCFIILSGRKYFQPPPLFEILAFKQSPILCIDMLNGVR